MSRLNHVNSVPSFKFSDPGIVKKAASHLCKSPLKLTAKQKKKQKLKKLKKEVSEIEKKQNFVMKSLKDKLASSSSSKCLSAAKTRGGSLASKSNYEKEIQELRDYSSLLREKLRTQSLEADSIANLYVQEQEKSSNFYNDLQSKNNKISEAQAQLASADNKLKESLKVIQNLKEEINSLRRVEKSTDLKVTCSFTEMPIKANNSIWDIEHKAYQETSALKSLIKQMENTLKIKEQKIEKLTKGNSELRKQIIEALNHADAEKSQSDLKTQKLKHQIKSLKQSLALVEQEFQQKAAEHSRDREKINDLHTQLSNANEFQQHLQKLLAETQALLKQNTDESESFQDRHLRLSTAFDSLQMENNVLNYKNQDLADIVTDLKRQVSEMTDELTTNETRFELKLKEIQDLERQNSDLLGKLSEENIKSELMSTDVLVDFTTDNLEINQNFGELKSQHSADSSKLKGKLIEKKSQIEELMKEIEFLNSENLNLNANLEQCQAENAELTQQICDKNKELEASSLNNQELRLELAKFNVLSFTMNEYCEEIKNDYIKLFQMNEDYEINQHLSYDRKEEIQDEEANELERIDLIEENDELKFNIKNIKLQHEDAIKQINELHEIEKTGYQNQIQSLNAQIATLGNDKFNSEEVLNNKGNESDRALEDNQKKIYDLETELGETKANLFLEIELRDNLIEKLMKEIQELKLTK